MSAIQVKMVPQTYDIHDIDSLLGVLEGRMRNWKEVLTFKECCAYLGVSDKTLSHWSNDGYIPFRRIPGSDKKFYIKSDVLEALKKL
jgi:excisionase family DNA binding protein